MKTETFNLLVWGWIALGMIMFFILLRIKAPYGRHTTRKWGVTISNRWGWFWMEIPSLVIFLLFFLFGETDKNLVLWIIAGLYLAHYVNRSLIYPFRIRTRGKPMPLAVAAMAVFFNVVNGSLLGYYIGSLQTHYDAAWLSDSRFISGMVLFAIGMAINISSDEKLIHLRKNSSNGYQIPRGGLFEKVSCPNFLGEIIEWLGYAILCWSLPALSFFIWTCCNLIPRALDHHRWYRKQFPDYPEHRKAVLPGIVLRNYFAKIQR